MARKIQTRGIVRVDRKEDGGQAIICEAFEFETFGSDPDNGMTVHLQSWDMDGEHTDLNRLIGKRVMITIETE